MAPETTPASDLAEIILHVERSIIAAAKLSTNELPESAIVSVVAIEPGSTSLKFAVKGSLAAAAASVLQAVQSNRVDSLPPTSHTELRHISILAERRGWTASLRDESGPRPGSDFPLGKIDAPQPPQTTEGPTTLYGICMSAGGVNPKASLRLTSGSIIRAEVDEDLAKALAHKLYEAVGVEGQATWCTSTWQIKSFRGETITDFADPSPSDAFSELAALADGVWNGVDAAAYVDDLRNGSGR